MKILIVCTLVVAVCLAEPPVNNRYLPPQQQQNFNGGLSAPSQTYGAPGFGVQRQTAAVFGNRPSSTYGAPNSRTNRPSSQYGPPRSQTPSSQYLPARNQLARSRPSSSYGAPRSQTLSSQYGAPLQAPSTQYGTPDFQAPSSQYSAPQFGTPSTQYGAPELGRTAPSQQYGAPGLGGNQYAQAGSRGADRTYLPPGRSGYAGDEDANSEPANYSFEYMVKDEPSGNDFGHRESRQGDRAEGLYYVLLPDGRKQTVEYEADENGYKPRITYEDTGLGAGSYDRNSQSGYQDYQNQGGPY